MSDTENCEFLDAAREAVEQLKKLSKDYPHLTTQPVRHALDNWNEDMFRRGELIWEAYQKVLAEKSAVETRLIELVDSYHVDDAIDIINSEFGKDINYYDLIDVVGKDRYIAALNREAVELQVNCISPEQTADLWNGSGKPTVGGDRWTATAVTVLMG
ncbi:MAG: hypothetical protein JAY99_00255 [Candidatus Thiodiazotropha lotti]|uniref:Uncharacterized protein n=1 Tax=Candidatus Thiodiazotropha endoloripes TaxID=1818881 RepID=A0A1E2UPF3_9GAMM|nr:hypothetical protein [Candidatus Thiodiazotropha endoloripes]MCG7897813.1 hypothetical protein [Candidatus Thiodiazotropha weberae]MCG7993543.1 hypothetical protein [Candidatus Thiodiazotropha lotti]MCG7901222.1 hypothetical protein [Candidatus Thiodiazotropha weberae]MCG7914438.1 hypothetical protein [Candidatus Thiodiazotropha weberae]MCG7997938.1 hypothetical protein [Candidatus Thiodiazotropha lotti]